MTKRTPRQRGPSPSVPSQQLPEVVRRLITWRRHNSLSQLEAVRALQRHFFRVSLASLASWEQGRRAPMAHTARLLGELLTRFPVVSVELPATRAEVSKKPRSGQERNV
jgi:hypothetical protein